MVATLAAVDAMDAEAEIAVVVAGVIVPAVAVAAVAAVAVAFVRVPAGDRAGRGIATRSAVLRARPRRRATVGW
jgi:hypothetical protein